MNFKLQHLFVLGLFIAMTASLCLSACTQQVTDPQDSVPSVSTEATTPTGETEITEPTAAENTESKETEPSHVHSYTEAVTAPDCANNGYTTYTCSCGYSYNGKEVPATGNHIVEGGECTLLGCLCTTDSPIYRWYTSIRVV